jgi:hypothetical protein
MAKQTINIGSGERKGDGESLRSAFDKINNNFTELYAGQELDLSAVDQSIVPAVTDTYDLGSPTKQWRSLYLTGSTVYFNGIPLSITDDGTLFINNQVAATPGGNLTWDSIVNKPTTTGSQGITATTDVNGNVNIGFSGQLYTGSSSWSFEEIITGEGEEAVISGKLSLPLITEIAGGDISLTTINLETFNNYIWRFRNDGTLTAPGAIQWDLDANNPGLTDVRINKVGDNLAISTDVILEGPSTWTFTKTGNLNLPRGAVIDTYGDGAGGYTSFSGAPGHYIEVRGKISDGFWSGGIVVHPDGSVDMIAQDGTASASWGFNVDGGLLFPDNSQQTTAFTGTADIARNIESENDVNIRVNLTDSTQRIWRFGEDGDLTLPQGGDIVDSNGNSVLGGGSTSVTVSDTAPESASAGDLWWESDTGRLKIYYADGDSTQWVDAFTAEINGVIPTDINQLDDIDGLLEQSNTGDIEFRNDTMNNINGITITNADQTTASTAQISVPANGSGSVSITNNSNIWSFDNNGDLTLPGDIRSEGNINIDINLLDSTLRRWTFGADGTLTFPSGETFSNGQITAALGGDAGLADNTNNNFIWVDSNGAYIETDDEFEHTWTFGTDGNLTLPGDIKSESAINIDVNLSDSTLRRWQFGEDGKFIVPGDIVGYQTYVSENPADERVTIQPSGSVDKPFLFTTDQTNGTWERSSMELPSAEINKAVSLGFPHNNITTGYIYNQGTDTLSGTEFNNAFNIMSNGTDVKISTVSGGGNKVWKFAQDGDITLPASGDVLDSTGVSQLANRVEGSWTVTAGTNTYSFTVPSDGTYVMWVKGNIPNGIITWNATLSVSNSNVPAIGTQYAWNYTGGGTPISLTAIPDQIKGVAGTISTDATYTGTTSNRFDFGINNTSGASQIVYYGYTKI